MPEMLEAKLPGRNGRLYEVRKMNVLSLFSGIGAFEQAMKNLNIPFNLVGFSEIDKYATKSYCAIHDVPDSLNLGDITKIDETKLPRVDFVTYGFPCQDISLAGNQQGLFNEDGSKTRSGLFFDALRIIKYTKPKVAIAENVKNLTSKKFKEQFDIVLKSLEDAGYNNYWKVLNAKDYGIPQNRERVFIVSIRRDVDSGGFEFPEGYPLKLRLKDMLETEVDEKFYLSEKMIRYISQTGTANFRNPDCKINLDIARPITTDPNKRAGTTNYLSPDLPSNYDMKVARCIGGVGEKTSNGGKQYYQQNRVYQGDIALAHVASISGNSYRYAVEELCDLRVRKLTPKECFRLMGFKDEEFEKAQSVCSNTQLYKQAGNSIVISVIQELIQALIDIFSTNNLHSSKKTEEHWEQLAMF